MAASALIIRAYRALAAAPSALTIRKYLALEMRPSALITCTYLALDVAPSPLITRKYLALEMSLSVLDRLREAALSVTKCYMAGKAWCTLKLLSTDGRNFVASEALKLLGHKGISKLRMNLPGSFH